jgi:uncharacterized protein (TIGR02453 family)
MNKQGFAAFPEEGLRFLRALKRNNNREWFQKHKTNYEQHIQQPMTALIQSLHADFQQFAPEVIATPKLSAYRIYRDTRFSKDKSPYKTHVAAVFPRSGLGKHEGAGFYLHLATDELLIGGGLYMPLPEDLRAVRSRILEHPRKFLNIVEVRKFRQMFGKLHGEQLSRIPRGFPADHAAGEYLRYKQFLAGRNFPPEFAATPRFYKTVLETFQTLAPLVRFLNEPIVRIRRTKDRKDGFFA